MFSRFNFKIRDRGCQIQFGWKKLTNAMRGVHVSVYDKNPEEHVCPTVVPDDLIAPQSDKYWAPNPQTGVFGPETDHNPTAGSPITASGGEDSVLEQKAFFRPLEDLEKPPNP
ncbi:late embryogenesis abundant protein At5g17165-like isoform X2 [Olea europaea var. sylvestris]|uniref:late embryogenesis abundant protein At5g17165-like isoform X2 n=1 Tax=Olea europaea var. sylvestris TaxID=158386 RepID=UPI000C1D08C9|nr:late embryogenesis abundant protein At5g17165-like isoform X2 [Olea europaea var. sylvestris]